MKMSTTFVIILDPGRHTVHRDGRHVDLTRTEFALLEYLMRHPGQVLTRQQILDQVCSKLTECFTTLDDTSCEEGVLETDNIDDDLGLDVSFESYEAIINAELDGTIVPIAEAATTCLAELSALSCSDPTVQSAYSSASPANFTNVHSMIPDGEDSCEGVY